tara:strand:+ start:289 stop:537 length:249 start_codon:yes stop_codon:yes gene_type:complete
VEESARQERNMERTTGITLGYDAFTGESTELKISATFKKENVLKQADVLQDWIGELTELYNKSLKEWRVNGSYSRKLFVAND